MELADYMPVGIVVGSFALLIFALLLVLRRRCPGCGTPAPLFRVPADFRQFWLGGWTCRQYRCGIDCWGRRVGGSEADPPV